MVSFLIGTKTLKIWRWKLIVWQRFYASHDLMKKLMQLSISTARLIELQIF